MRRVHTSRFWRGCTHCTSGGEYMNEIIVETTQHTHGHTQQRKDKTKRDEQD